MALFTSASPMNESEIIARLRDAGIDTDEFEQRLKKARNDAESIKPGITPASTTKLLDAAVRGVFLPSDLGFSPDTNIAPGSELGGLLAQCDVVSIQSRQMWRLRSAVRRQVLSQAQTSGTLLTAAAIGPDPADPEGSMLRRVLNGDIPAQDSLATSELQTFATVSDWLAETSLAPVPAAGEIRREIAKRELLDPFRLLVGRSLEDGADGKNDRIVGREKQTELLRSYVGIVPPDQIQHYLERAARSLWQKVTFSDTANEPIAIEGIGGIGKSSLVAKFILDHALFPGVDLPFAYLDFDRAALAPREPLQLLIDISSQFGIWFPQIEHQLAGLRGQLRNSIDLLAANPGERSREDQTHSRLNACCFSLKSIVESINQGRAPVLLVFDTFEIVQYDDVAVAGVKALLAALRAPKPENQERHAEPWTNLRIVVAGRAGAPEIETSQTPIKIPPLPPGATEQLIRRRNESDQIGLTKQQISALAKPLRGSPLDVTIIMNWLKSREPPERKKLADEIIAEVTSDDGDEHDAEGGPLANLRITGILVNRMINHLKDRDIQKLAIPGLVVRAVTPDVIRNVMAPASGLVESADRLPPGAENELFRRLQQERWLVTSGPGDIVRHRPEVRLAMLDLMRRQNPQRFDATNQAAIDYFRDRAASNPDARAEVIYHLLLGGDLNIEEAERLWTPAVSQPLASAVDDLKGLAQIYLKARLGRSVDLQALQTLPTAAQLSVLVSFGKRFMQRGLFAGLKDMIDGVQKAEDNPALLGLQWETLYRSGRWQTLREVAKRQLSSGKLAPVVAALRENDFELAREVDEKAGWPLRFALRLATRNAQMADQMLATGILSPSLDISRASKLNEAFWDFSAFVIHASGSLPDFDHRELDQRLLDMITTMSAQDRRLPPAATTSGALRVLVFHETRPERTILRRLDFESYFSTVCGREVQELQKACAATIEDLSSNSISLSPPMATANEFLKKMSTYPAASVIADPSVTREFASVVRTLIETGSQRAAVGILRTLALTFPDWLEPLGHALTRAFGGKVPSQETWWSSVESYFGVSKPRWRGRQLSDGHEILALADEAGSLPEAIGGYRGLVDPKKHQSADFLDIVQAFDRWQAALESALLRKSPT